MIKPHHFIALAGATVLSLVLAFGLYASANRWSAGTIEGQPFLPEVAGQLDKVASIEVVQGGGKLVLAQKDKRWQVANHDGFPAKAEPVRALLLSLAEAKLIEPKTAIAAKLPMLELEDPAGKDAKSRGVRLLDGAGKVITSIVLGKTRYDAFGSGRGGTYARRADQTQSWLATGDAKVTPTVTDWVETKLLAADAEKVTRLTLAHPGEAPLVIEKGAPPKPAAAPGDAKDPKAAAAAAPKDTRFHLATIPAGQKMKKDASVDQIVDVFGSLDLENVRKLTPPAADAVSTLTLEQEGGPTVTVKVRKDGKDGKERWISIEAAGKDEATNKLAAEINQRTKGWEFKILAWKGDEMLKRLSDLLEKA